MKYKVTMLQRIGWGIILSILSMAAAAIVEVSRKQTSSFDLHDISSECDSSGQTPVSKMSIFWQVPQFALIGASEVLASITGLEFFFSQSPVQMRSVMMSFYLVTVGVASWMTGILIAMVNARKGKEWITDNLNHGRLEYYFTLLTFLSLANFFGFLYSSHRYKYQWLDENHKADHQSTHLQVHADEEQPPENAL
ncbi:hypothetical protein RFI_30977 [Reticulomyxa filosa]|uniref:Uncharacterized protein n=1 Tax=Reticulomyxa filosa TaxID=46433 RepID=X6LXU8_RETFI|nr:hypothetical protein RFI_30977 [Reticulomyxa filosa]|eukprot:ETO06419.1 hypothetical protein RFI_30977 [Reticulomyxa filosa]